MINKNFQIWIMGDTLKLLDFIYEPQKCWTFKEFNELYFGSDYNTSKILRFTNLIYVMVYSCFKCLKSKKLCKVFSFSGRIQKTWRSLLTVVLIQIFCKCSQNIWTYAWFSLSLTLKTRVNLGSKLAVNGLMDRWLYYLEM